MLIKILLVLNLYVTISVALFPKEIEKCKAGDVDCIVERANEFVRKFSKGNANIGNVQFDPFQVENITANNNADGAVNLRMYLKRAQLFGLSQFTFDRAVGFTKDPFTTKLELYGNIPELKLNGIYETDGRIILLPIKGEGDINLTLKNCKTGLKVKPKAIKKNGLRYLHIEKVKILLEPSDFKISLTNLFNGNKELGDSLVATLNENWKDVWNELSTTVLKVTADVIKDNLQPILDKYDYDDFYLQD